MLSLLLAAGQVAAAPIPAHASADEIVVTAIGRRASLLDVPAAVLTVDGAALARSGDPDLRTMNQSVPSLLVSSSSNEAGGAGARIRGVGTVGDNPGLESSVVTVVDGVYRPRAAVALTELGAVDRIEVLSGPQGTLFGRNASAGLIAVTTAAPSFTTGGYAAVSIGNYASRRLEGGVTGGLSDTLAARLDGVWLKRDGFVRDVVSGRTINGRDRWLLRGKLLYRPDDTLSATLSFDLSQRREECCAGVYLPARDLRSSTPGAGGGTVQTFPSSIAALIRSFGAPVLDGDPYARLVALTPGQSFRQDVDDGGVGLTIEKRFGGVTLSSISAWRGNRFIKGQDADFSALDLLQRPSDGSGAIRFSNWSQELRLQGKAGRIDWLIGGYLGDEVLNYRDNLQYGSDYDRFASARIGALGGNFAAFPQFGFADLNGFARAFGGNAVAAVVQNVPITGTGERDRWRQHDANQALFTHDIVHLTNRLSLTIGARWTRDLKRLDGQLASTSACATYVADIQALRALAAGGGPAAAATLANNVLAPLASYPCNINSIAGAVSDRRVEQRWSGTAAVDYRLADGVAAYASWSRGYKAGGFNLDRAALFSTATLGALPASSLHFAPETVDSIELGAKLHRARFDLAITLFDARFRNFQLNTYTGTNFLVSNIAGCRTSLNGTDADAIAGNSPCADTKAGVVSRGIELQASATPIRDLRLDAGYTHADTRYADNLVGSPDPLAGNTSLQPVLFLLPGHRLSNAPADVATGAATWQPAIGHSLRGLAYAGLRWQSAIDTGSDLLTEKRQGGFTTVNARLGIGGRDGGWSAELWAQNLFDASYVQVAFAEPLQGGGSGGLPGTYPAVARFGTSATQLFGAFLGEPRTWGVTVRKRF